MQRNDNKNAGFSGNQPARIYAPVITDPIYNFNSVNVEEDRNNLNSLFHWLKNLINIRKTFPVFGTGTIEFFYPDNKKILVYIISREDSRMLCGFNLSSTEQIVEIDLMILKNSVPIDIIGGTNFPIIWELLYLLTQNCYGYYIFHIMEQCRSHWN
jgi:maltose alpha-D-glucosyltransferase/alpha-amylase